MRNSGSGRHVLIFTAAAATLLLAMALAALTGPAAAGLNDIAATIVSLLSGKPLQDGAQMIVGEIRLPRIVVAALCGAALAAAGTVSQALFRNPLASPSIVGTESGGALAAVIVFYSGTALASSYTLPLAAMFGCAAATVVVFLAGNVAGWQRLENLLLAGFALNTLLGAATSLTISLSLEDYQKSAAMMHWLLGGFQARGWEHAGIGVALTAVGAMCAWRLAPRLDILALGEEHASTLAVDTKKLRAQSIAVIAVLAGGAVAIAGAIPFVGLVVPHISRLLIGPGNRRLLLLSIINGMTLILVADILARTVRSPAEMEVGIVTSLIGAPYFLWLLLRQQRRPQ
jgi:iron complex transport system permease protein